MEGQLEVNGWSILSVTCQAHVQATDNRLSLKKVENSSGVKGKALEDQLKTFATN